MPGQPKRWGPTPWALGLGLIVLAGLALRIGYVLVFKTPTEIIGDAYYYHHGANLLADGEGFVHPFRFLQDGEVVPGADHPPAYVVALAGASLLGFRTFLEHQLWSCVLGAATVGVMGFAGRDIAGPRAGLIAAAVTALYPNFWFNDAFVMSETLVMLGAAVTVWVAYRFSRRPRPSLAAGLGAACGVMALTRSESVVLVPLLLVPLVCFMFRLPWRRRLQLIGIGVGTAVLTVSPWVVPNLVRFEHPVTLSTTLGPALVIGNCDDTYFHPWVGWWSYDCIKDDIPPGDPSEQERVYRDRGLDYVRAHTGRVPFVVAARIGRTFGLYQPSQQIFLDQIEMRELEASRVGLFMYYSLATAAVFGAVTLRRRRVPLTPLLALVATVMLAVTITFGQTRYRATAEVAIVLLASVAFDAALTRSALRRHRRGGPLDEPPAQPATHEREVTRV